MFAVVKTGGKQYKVQPGLTLNIEKIAGEAGDDITLNDVLLYSDGEDIRIGNPLVENASIKAKIVAQTKAPKVVIFKKQRRHRKQLKKGHRQPQTVIKVTDIEV